MIYDREAAAKRAEASTSNSPGTCQLWTRTQYAAPSAGDRDGDGDADAVDGWLSEPANRKHAGDRNPPRGVPVAWSGGSHGYGHRAISLGGGKIRSTDAGGSGRVATVDLGWVEAHWGLHYLGWSETIDGYEIPVPAPKPPPKPEPRRLTLATFNVERGRPKPAAVGDVLRLFDKHDLDGLAVQEAEGYFQEFGRLKGLELHADPENPENALLVPEGRGTDFLAADYGDGWQRTGGAHRGPGIFPRVTIDGWLRLAAIHYPPSTTWPGGVLHTPDARRDDVVEIAEKAKAFLERDNLTRVVAGDWNEPPTTAGVYSPLWVARETDSQIQAPKSREGHGRIDFGIVKRGRMVNVVKDTEIREGSDHEPVVFEVVES